MPKLGRHVRGAFLFGAGAVWACPTMVTAQDLGSPVQGKQGADTKIEDVIVTAQKRRQPLNRVGVAVSVLSSAALQQRRVTSLQDLTAQVPSLSYSDTPTGTPIITLRGIGFYDTSLSSAPAVSLYTNQVPLPFPIMSSHSIFDLERVEVLKGPQGILFGENSTGGAINYIPAAPSKAFHAGATIGYGSYNDLTEEAYVTGAVTDTLTVRVSERSEGMDGWQQSSSRPDDTNGRVSYFTGRLLADYTPTDRAKFELNMNGWVDTGQPQAAQYVGLNVQHPGFENPLLKPIPFSANTPTAADWYKGLPRRDNTFFQASLRGDIKVTDDVTLTSISSYSDFNQDEADSFDGVPLLENDFSQGTGHIHSFYQELRLANASTNRWRWLVGGNYENDSIAQSDYYNYGATSSNTELGTIGYPIYGNIYYTHQQDHTVAAFANSEYDLTHEITLKAGIRYTEADLSTKDCGTDINPPFYVGNLFYQILDGGAAGPYRLGECYALDNLKVPFSGVRPGLPGFFVDSFNQNNVSWDVGLDWKPDGNILLYANIAKGYKAGGFPTVGASTFSQYLPVTQEAVLAYEAGFKLSLLDHQLQVNGGGFYYDYSNKQIRSRVIDPVFGALDVLQNIPKSTIKGAELEITSRPFPGLTLTSNATYVDAVIDQFTGVNAAGVAADFAGTAIPFTPRWEIAVSGDYRFPLSDTYTAFVGATVSYRSKTTSIIGGSENPPNATPANIELFGIKGYTLLDVRAGIETGRWSVDFWGKNVTNTYYWNSVYPAFDTITRYAGLPAMFGGTLGYRW